MRAKWHIQAISPGQIGYVLHPQSSWTQLIKQWFGKMILKELFHGFIWERLPAVYFAH
jgi:hypothetical protein